MSAGDTNNTRENHFPIFLRVAHNTFHNEGIESGTVLYKVTLFDAAL